MPASDCRSWHTIPSVRPCQTQLSSLRSRQPGPPTLHQRHLQPGQTLQSPREAQDAPSRSHNCCQVPLGHSLPAVPPPQGKVGAAQLAAKPWAQGHQGSPSHHNSRRGGNTSVPYATKKRGATRAAQGWIKLVFSPRGASMTPIEERGSRVLQPSWPGEAELSPPNSSHQWLGKV